MKRTGSHRILHLTAPVFPPAIRVVKESLSLLEAGFEVGVMCPPIQGRPAHEVWRGVQVFRPEALRSAERTADKLLFQSTYVSPAWIRGIREVVRSFRPDVLHVHDIWLGRSALLAGGGARLVLDLHENMSAAVVEYLKGYRGVQWAFNAAVKPEGRVLRYERALIARSDMVLAVVPEAEERIRASHPSLKPNIVTVENLENHAFAEVPTLAEQVIPQDIFSILYIGGFGVHRGIDTLIRAMRHLADWRVNARLYLVGAKESTFLTMLRELVTELGVGEQVEIVKWVPSQAVPTWIRQASVCAVPHHSNAHTNATIPHKLYQYMILGRPVLVSTSPPLARTVRASGAGAIFEAGDALDCATQLRTLAEDPSARARCGEAGRHYVLEQGNNWEQVSAPTLVAAYERLFASNAGAGPRSMERPRRPGSVAGAR